MINVHIWDLFPLVTASRELYSKGIVRLAVSEQDVRSTEHHVPILAPDVPVLDNPPGRQVQHPQI